MTECAPRRLRRLSCRRACLRRGRCTRVWSATGELALRCWRSWRGGRTLSKCCLVARCRDAMTVGDQGRADGCKGLVWWGSPLALVAARPSHIKVVSAGSNTLSCSALAQTVLTPTSPPAHLREALEARTARAEAEKAAADSHYARAKEQVGVGAGRGVWAGGGEQLCVTSVVLNFEIRRGHHCLSPPNASTLCIWRGVGVPLQYQTVCTTSMSHPAIADAYAEMSLTPHTRVVTRHTTHHTPTLLPPTDPGRQHPHSGAARKPAGHDQAAAGAAAAAAARGCCRGGAGLPHPQVDQVRLTVLTGG